MIRFYGMGWSAGFVAAVLSTGCLGLDPEVDDRVRAADTVSYRSVDVGAFHACGITTGNAAYCWGGNGIGQLGVGDFFDRFEPWPVAQGTLDFTEVIVGGTFTCARTVQSDVHCWGGNSAGQLGVGELSFSNPVPDLVRGDIQFSDIAVGAVHACGLASAGQAWCWGSTESGRLGNGQSAAGSRTAPVAVEGGLSFQSLTAGGGHSCGLSSLDSKAYCWGAGRFGQLGIGTTDNQAEPTLVDSVLQFQSIDAGEEHTCALTLDGAVYCWGSGADGRLGRGSTADAVTPQPVSGDLFFEAVSTGGGHTCALSPTGDVYCWGANDSGQLGDGTTIDRTEPTLVSTEVPFESVSAGAAALTTVTCGRSTGGVIFCWGYGLNGQLGNADVFNSTTPTRVVGQR